MRLTNDEIVEAGLHIKTWMHNLQVAARAPKSPTFSVKGPCMHEVRYRRAASTVATRTGRHSFMGGETFKIGGVVAEEDKSTGEVLISLNMLPATAALAKEFSGMSITLQEGIETFDGLEAFVLEHRAHSIGDKALLGREHSGAPKPKVIKKEDNPMWGAW